MHSELVYCRPPFVVQTTGPNLTSINWRYFTTQRSRCYWTGSFQRELTPAADARQTLGSTTSVGRLNARPDDYSALYVGRILETPLQ